MDKCAGKNERLCHTCARRFEYEQGEGGDGIQPAMAGGVCVNHVDIGRFGPLRVELVDHTANAGQGEWRLLEPLRYHNYRGEAYEVPAGFLTDFASVPRLPGAYVVAGCRGHASAVLHDHLCRSATIPRRDADDVFYEALLATGVPPAVASMMHIAVRSYSESLDKTKGWEDVDMH